MTEEPEPIAVTCGRVVPGRFPPSITASTIGNCSHCKYAVWVAASSRKVLAEHPEARVYCLNCVMAGVTQISGFATSESQIAELHELTGDAPSKIESFMARFFGDKPKKY